MKIFIVTMVLSGLIGLAFGYWGLYTQKGNARFDEMDGLYPFFGGVAGGALIVIAIAVLAFRYWMGSAR